MKISILLLIIVQFLTSADIKRMKIGHNNYSIITENYNIYSSKGVVIKFYKGKLALDENPNKRPEVLLSFTLEDSTGTCSNQKVQEGSYEANATHIVIYNTWDREGNIYNAPKGVRKQVYEIQQDHSMKRISSHIYIETQRKNWDETSGMQYLFNAPTNKEEKEAFKDYILDVEQRFKGVFVFDAEAKVLQREVQKAIERKQKNRWN